MRGILTHVGIVVDQNDFPDEVFRGPVQDGMHGPQQYRPRLVVEAHDHGRLGQIVQIPAGLFAPEKRHETQNLDYTSDNNDNVFYCILAAAMPAINYLLVLLLVETISIHMLTLKPRDKRITYSIE